MVKLKKWGIVYFYSHEVFWLEFEGHTPQIYPLEKLTPGLLKELNQGYPRPYCIQCAKQTCDGRHVLEITRDEARAFIQEMNINNQDFLKTEKYGIIDIITTQAVVGVTEARKSPEWCKYASWVNSGRCGCSVCASKIPEAAIKFMGGENTREFFDGEIYLRVKDSD
jgi:hypothetical protein